MLLDRADKMAMSNCVEIRPPYLDSDLADFALCVQASKNLTLFATKTLLRAAAKTILPKGMLIEKKMGFPTPLNLWLKSDLFEPARNLLLESKPSELLSISTNEVKRMFEEHRNGKSDHSGRLLMLISLSLWIR